MRPLPLGVSQRERQNRFFLLYFNLIIMENINQATMQLPEELSGLSMEEIQRLETYYVTEAECLMSFLTEERKEPLTFMLKHLRATEWLFRELQFPWEESVPVLYASLINYIAREEDKQTRKRLTDLMTDLISKLKFLSKKGSLVTGLYNQYRKQRKEVEALVALRRDTLNEPQP